MVVPSRRMAHESGSRPDSARRFACSVFGMGASVTSFALAVDRGEGCRCSGLRCTGMARVLDLGTVADENKGFWLARGWVES